MFPLAKMRDSLKKIFLLDVKVTLGGSNIWKKKKKESIAFISHKFKFILAGE